VDRVPAVASTWSADSFFLCNTEWPIDYCLCPAFGVPASGNAIVVDIWEAENRVLRRAAVCAV
jgi:hypothetical protein